MLSNDCVDSFFVSKLDDGAHLGTEHVVCLCFVQQCIKFGHWLHHLHAVLLVGQTFVDFEKWNYALVLPQELGCAFAVDGAIHCHLEQDCADYSLAREGGTFDDPGAHGMDEVVHLLVARILGCFDAVQLKRLGGAAAALVECCNETLATFCLVHHFGVHLDAPFRYAYGNSPRCGAEITEGSWFPVRLGNSGGETGR